jgi:hypothetical protein
MFAAILLVAIPVTLPTQVIQERVHFAIQKEFCKSCIELRDRENKRKKGVDTSPENDLAIERLRNRKALAQHRLERMADRD